MGEVNVARARRDDEQAREVQGLWGDDTVVADGGGEVGEPRIMARLGMHE
jgi:hypothetical protein